VENGAYGTGKKMLPQRGEKGEDQSRRKEREGEKTTINADITNGARSQKSSEWSRVKSGGDGGGGGQKQAKRAWVSAGTLQIKKGQRLGGGFLEPGNWTVNGGKKNQGTRKLPAVEDRWCRGGRVTLIPPMIKWGKEVERQRKRKGRRENNRMCPNPIAAHLAKREPCVGTLAKYFASQKKRAEEKRVKAKKNQGKKRTIGSRRGGVRGFQRGKKTKKGPGSRRIPRRGVLNNSKRDLKSQANGRGNKNTLQSKPHHTQEAPKPPGGAGKGTGQSLERYLDTITKNSLFQGPGGGKKKASKEGGQKFLLKRRRNEKREYERKTFRRPKKKCDTQGNLGLQGNCSPIRGSLPAKSRRRVGGYRVRGLNHRSPDRGGGGPRLRAKKKKRI